MGFSTSGSVAIIFVGLLVAASIAFPALESARDRQSTAMDERDERALDMRNTAIDVETALDGSDRLVVSVTNVGSTTIAVNETDLLVNGSYLSRSAYDTDVEGDADRSIVQPGETLTIATTEENPDRVKVITAHGIAETITEV